MQEAPTGLLGKLRAGPLELTEHQLLTALRKSSPRHARALRQLLLLLLHCAGAVASMATPAEALLITLLPTRVKLDTRRCC